MDDPQTIVRALFDQVAKKDLDGLMAYFEEDAVFIDCAGPVRVEGRPAIREMIAEMWIGLPDFHVEEIINIASANDVVICELELFGTHKGQYLDQPPTNVPVSWGATVVYELTRAGTVSREAYYYDSAGVLDQIQGRSKP